MLPLQNLAALAATGLLAVGALAAPVSAQAPTYPSSVRIEYDAQDNGNYSMVGNGVLISDEWVLTVAHLVQPFENTLDRIRVVAGDDDRCLVSGLEQIRAVSEAFYPDGTLGAPAFDPNNSASPNDIGLMHLASPVVPDGVTVQPIAMASPLSFAGDVAAVGGFWAANNCSNLLACGLQDISMQALTTAAAQTYLSNLPGATITDSQICLLDSNLLVTPLGGSAGVGAFVNQGGKDVVAGVMSWGVNSGGCKLASYPAVFTRVSAYRTWITSITGVSGLKAKASFDGLSHLATGDATVEVDANGELAVSLPPSGGVGGISIELPKALGIAVSHELTLEDIDQLGMLPSGASLAFTTSGTVNGTPGATIGTSSITKVGDQISFAADYSSLGSTMQTVEYYLNGQLQSTGSIPNGEPAGYRKWDCHDDIQVVHGVNAFGFIYTYIVNPCPLAWNGTCCGTLLADKILIKPDYSGLTASLNDVDLNVYQVPTTKIVKEVTTGLAWTNIDAQLASPSTHPSLLGTGPLGPATSNTLQLAAKPGTPNFLVLGTSAINIDFLGGTLVPYPTTVLPLATTAAGESNLLFSLPSTVPLGLDLYFQVWAADAASSTGVTATNALKATTSL